ncbi:hypothetical protein V494_00257 [Pseudogymnoascus sp. VKM F-4513 (FW-928)]|nr:hypothetical protein V494_00257 [Pseudogymnoascus sp. VKM F-4513 (FW-928)]
MPGPFEVRSKTNNILPCAAQTKMTNHVLFEPENVLIKPEDLIRLNYEFMRIICEGGECMKAISPSVLSKHLQKRHNIKKEETAKFIDSIAPMMLWRKMQTIPEDGLKPQRGIRVVDGFRCRHCLDFRSRSAEDIEKHWTKEQHGAPAGSLVVHVRLQSWGVQSFGERPVYWIVVEEGAKSEEDKDLLLGASEAMTSAEDWEFV